MWLDGVLSKLYLLRPFRRVGKVIQIAVEQITYKNIDPKVRRTIMFGLGLAMLAACFDGTIVGTCAPIIAQDLNGTELYAWMVTAYLLCETIMIPIAGKLSDLYGRKPLFLIGLGVFVLGSILAGLSTSMEMFIVCRGMQGLGGGILIPVATAAVADLYSPRDRARIQGILGAVFGIGSGIGPLLGGYINDFAGWHWLFYINVPLALVSFLLTIKKFPTPIRDDKPSIDYKGIALLTLFIADILLFFEWAGKDFEWISVQSVVMIAVALALLVVFCIVERKAVEPILSPTLLKNRTVIMASVFMFIFGIGMMGAMMYSSMFSISVLGYTPLQAGEYSLAMVAGMMITAMSSGALVNKTGYRPWLIAGPIITFAGLMLMSRMNPDTTAEYLMICLFIFGFGLGCMMSVIMTAVQNSSKSREMGMTTSSVNLIRSIGATIGTAIFSMVINNKLSGELSGLVPPEIYDIIPHDTGVLDALASAAANVMAGVGTLQDMEILSQAENIILAFSNSVDFSFLVGGFIILFLLVIGIFFKVQVPKDDEDMESESTVIE